MSLTLKTKSRLAQNENSLNVEITGSATFYIHSSDGKKYLDFTSGWCVGNLGWSNRAIQSAIKRYSGPAYVYPAFDYEPWDRLAKALTDIAPGNLDKCIRTTGGSESVELALQVASLYTGRKKFLSLEDSYHGNSLGALSVGASDTKEDLRALIPGCVKIKGELSGKRLEHIETVLSSEEIAAFILEPVQMNLGVQIPEKDFMKGLQKLCKKYGTLLVADEVATGFGRTGKLFACEHYDLEPDLLTVGKALSGGFAGIGATLTTKAIFRKIKDKLNAYSTYGWHPLSTAAALACVQQYTDHHDKILDNVAQRSQQMRTALSQMEFKKNGRLSMIGLAIAVNVDDEKYATSIKNSCQKKGLLITTQEEKLVLFPPLTITRSVTEKGLEILRNSV